MEVYYQVKKWITLYASKWLLIMLTDTKDISTYDSTRPPTYPIWCTTDDFFLYVSQLEICGFPLT